MRARADVLPASPPADGADMAVFWVQYWGYPPPAAAAVVEEDPMSDGAGPAGRESQADRRDLVVRRTNNMPQRGRHPSSSENPPAPSALMAPSGTIAPARPDEPLATPQPIPTTYLPPSTSSTIISQAPLSDQMLSYAVPTSGPQGSSSYGLALPYVRETVNPFNMTALSSSVPPEYPGNPALAVFSQHRLPSAVSSPSMMYQLQHVPQFAGQTALNYNSNANWMAMSLSSQYHTPYSLPSHLAASNPSSHNYPQQLSAHPLHQTGLAHVGPHMYSTPSWTFPPQQQQQPQQHQPQHQQQQQQLPHHHHHPQQQQQQHHHLMSPYYFVGTGHGQVPQGRPGGVRYNMTSPRRGSHPVMDSFPRPREQRVGRSGWAAQGYDGGARTYGFSAEAPTTRSQQPMQGSTGVGLTPSSSHPSVPRGPPRKPKQSGHALWVGNLPAATSVIELKDYFSREATRDIESVFLISKSNCAFVNYKTEEACMAAMTRFHDSRFKGVRLVCRLRRTLNSTAPGAPSGPAASLQSAAPVDGSSGSSKRAEASSPVVAKESMSARKESSRDGEGGAKRDKFFIVKSLTVEDLEASVRNGIWATQAHNEITLNEAHASANNVYLIFSANKSGEYFGYARMLSPISDESASTISWAPKVLRPEDVDLPKAIPTPATEFAPKGRVIDDSARGTIFWEADSEADDRDEEQEKEKEEESYEAPEASVVAEGEKDSTNKKLTEFVDGETPPVEDGGGPSSSSFSQSQQLLPPEQEEQQASYSRPPGRPFRIEWLSTTRLPFYRTRGLRNPWNGNREVKIARDGTELEPSVGRRLLSTFHRAGGGSTVAAAAGVGAGEAAPPPPPPPGGGGVGADGAGRVGATTTGIAPPPPLQPSSDIPFYGQLPVGMR